MKSVDIRIWNWLWQEIVSQIMEEQSPGLGCMGSAFKYKKFKNKEKNENFSKNINFWGKMKMFEEWIFFEKNPKF